MEKASFEERIAAARVKGMREAEKWREEHFTFKDFCEGLQATFKDLHPYHPLNSKDSTSSTNKKID